MENKTVRHVLIFKTSQRITSQVFDEFIQAFRGLSQKIDGILAFEYGANSSPEGLDQGMTHVVSLTFTSPEARDAYLPHPEHVKFARWLGEIGIFEKLLVVDYTPQDE